jgi:hypothetical protein
MLRGDGHTVNVSAVDRGRRLTIRHLALIALLGTLLIGGAWLAIRLVRVWQAVTALQVDLAAAELMVAAGTEHLDPEPAVALLQTTHNDLEALRDAAGPFLPLAPRLGWLPRYGPDVEAAPTLLEIALDLTAAGESAAEPLTPLLEATQQAAPSESGTLLEELTTTLAAARPRLRQAHSLVRQAQTARETLPKAHLTARLQRCLKRLDRYLPLLEQGIQGALLAPDLLGAETARTYLILVQNEDELRATGGFISGVARITVEEGRLVELHFEDSYAVDDFSKSYPVAPRPVRDVWGPVPWVFRDSNWSPDFPTTAQRAVALYQVRYDDVTVDGVIALDQEAVRQLVAAMEPLTVAGHPQPVTGETVIQAARAAWAPSDPEDVSQAWWEQRKDFMGQTFVAVMHKLQREPDQVDSVAMARALVRSLEERHLFIYLPEGEAGAALREAGWDGALQDPPGDYLMVVDANLGLNKVNPLISETLTYTVDLREPEQPRATVTLLHRHTGTRTGEPCRHGLGYAPTYAQMMRRCYWDYVRVYASQGSHLLKATPHPVPGRLLLSGEARAGEAEVLPDEQGKSVFASFFVLERGHRITTDFVYQLPAEVVERTGESRRYRLYLQKQGGTDARDVHVVIHLPAGATLRGSSPPATQRTAERLVYRLRLRTDVTLSAIWQPQHP